MPDASQRVHHLTASKFVAAHEIGRIQVRNDENSQRLILPTQTG